MSRPARSPFTMPMSPKQWFRDCVVWTKRNTVPGTFFRTRGLQFYLREDGEVYASRENRKGLMKIAAVCCIVEVKGQTKEVRRGFISYIRKNEPGALPLP